jgi:hypothetical protein
MPAARLNPSMVVVGCLVSRASVLFTAACFGESTDAVLHEADEDGMGRPERV